MIKLKELEKEFTIEGHSFETYLKYEKYSDGLYFSKDRIFFILDILGAIDYYSSNIDLINYYNKLKVFLRSIPKDSNIIIQSLFLPYRQILFEPKKAKTNNPVIKEAYNSIINKIKKAVKEGYYDKNSLLREIKNFLIISFPRRDKSILDKLEDILDDRKEKLGENILDAYQLYKRALLTSLSSLDVKFKEVEPNEFLYLMFTLLNQDLDPFKLNYFEDIPLNRQILYNLITTNFHEISYTNKRWAIAFLEDLKFTSPGFLLEFLLLKRPFFLSTILQPRKVEFMKAAIELRKRTTFNKEIIATADQVIRELDYVEPYTASVILGVLIEDYKEISVVEAELADFLSEYGWKIHFEDTIAPDMLLSALPAHYNDKISRNVNIYLDHALCFLNFRSFRSEFSKEGIILVSEQLTPKYVNIFDGQSYGTLITGGSGSGKTFFSQYSVIMNLSQNEKVFFIDPAGNLEPLTELLEGKFYKISLSNDSNGLNIFPKLSYNELINNKDILNQIIETVTKMILLGTKDQTLAISEKAKLQTLILYMYENTPEQDLKTFYEVITAAYNEQKDPTLKEYAAAISMFLEQGTYGNLISTEEYNFNNQLIVFDLSTIKENQELLKLAVYSIMSNISREVLKSEQRIHTYIDEAHFLITNQETVNFISTGIRVWRTYSGAMYLITQQLTDLLENKEVGEGIFKTINNYFILNQSFQSLKEAQPYLGYNDSELKALSDVRTKTGVYSMIGFYQKAHKKDGNKVFGRFYLSLPKFLYWLLTTDSDEKIIRKNLINKYLNQGFNKKEAIAKAISELAKE